MNTTKIVAIFNKITNLMTQEPIIVDLKYIKNFAITHHEDLTDEEARLILDQITKYVERITPIATRCCGG